ncbi:MAG: hypothetical protein IAE82_11600 [Opitutaceae bacterium]|nr:hypothetical protein [Opitutaceae bacterium]
MNTCLKITCMLALLAAATCPAIAGERSTPVPTAIRVRAVEKNGTDVVKVGSTESRVIAELGQPIAKYGDNVWVYPNYHANQPVDEKLGCTTLLITLENDRVSGIALVNQRAAKVVAARTKRDPAFFNRQLVASR